MHVRAVAEDGWQIEQTVLQMLQRRLQVFFFFVFHVISQPTDSH